MLEILPSKQKMVKLLETLLEETKTGQLTSFVVTAKYKNGNTNHIAGGKEAIKAWNDVARTLYLGDKNG
jgi:hypothetical protein